MKKLITASVLLFVLVALQTKAFAMELECEFKDQAIEGVQSIELNDEDLVINKQLEIPLSRTRVKCGNFGRQTRLDGDALGYMVILKTCTTEAKMEGELVDAVKKVAATVLCNPKEN